MKDALFLVEFDGIPQTGIAIHHIRKGHCSLIEKKGNNIWVNYNELTTSEPWKS